MAVLYNQTAFDSGECRRLKGIQRTNIPLFVIIKSPRDIGTTFSPQKCCRSQLGCAYSLPFCCLSVSAALEPQIDKWAPSYRATAARDGLVKVFDVGAEVATYDSASPYSRGSPTRPDWEQRAIRCHSDSVKRITTELSPDVFLTVSEVSITARVYVTTSAERMKQDGTVRQHDLRAPEHRCGDEGTACSTPLVKVSHRLFSMSIAPSAPHQLVVAGDHPYVCFVLLLKTLF